MGTKFNELPLQWVDVPDIHERILDCGGNGATTTDLKFKDGDGTARLLSARITPILNDESGKSRLIVATDVTMQRQMASQLDQAHRMESVGQLAAGVAHEINTPMQYIGDNVRFVAKSLQKLDPLLDCLKLIVDPEVTDDQIHEVRQELADSFTPKKIKNSLQQLPEALNDSIDGVESVSKIVSAMKEFSHPGTDQKSQVCINHILESTITVAKNEWKYVADIETELDPDLQKVDALSGDLNQAFLNIIVNASHAIGDRVQADEISKGLIRIKTTEVDDSVVISIEDNGGGIPSHVQSKVFEPFFTTKEVGKGTGQGLAIAFNVITKKHDGAISFDVEEGRRHHFPHSASSYRNRDPRNAKRSSWNERGRTMKILLVDDEEQVVRGVSRMIQCEKDEWEVSTALSGKSALELLSDEPFDVVVSDMRMPGMDGAELLDQVEKLYPGMLRVVLSGQADRDTVLRAVKPMHQYLSKPCDPEKLIHVIDRAEVFQQTITSAEVLDAIGRANCLPSFPETVNEIDAELDSENGSAKSVTDILSKDPIICARLLQLANSAIFSPRQPITDIDRAVSLVGMQVIRALVISSAVYPENSDTDWILSAQQVMDHAFEVAAVAKKISGIEGCTTDEKNSAFAAGLLHDAGKLVLLNAFPEKYKTVLDEAAAPGCALEQLELRNFGASHQGIGGYLFDLWGLPEDVITSVASHHSFEACYRSPGELRQIVFAANWITHQRTDEELDALAQHSEDPEKAAVFVNQIRQWQEQVSNNDNE